MFTPTVSSRFSRLPLRAVTVALLISGILLSWSEYLGLKSDFQHSLLVQGRILAENSTAPVLFNDAKTATETLGALRGSPDILAAAIHRIEKDGHASLFAAHGMDGAGRPLEPASMWGTVNLSLPLMVEGTRIGDILLIADLASLYSRLARFVGTLLGVIIGTLLATNFLLGRMRRRVVEAETSLERLAHFDELTGLPNRNLFNDRIRHALARAQRQTGKLDLLFFDLDNFKVVNDSLGHQAGDELLREAARRLQLIVRHSDTIARFGGDEFTVILEDCEEARVAHVARNILETLSQSYDIAGSHAYVGVSMGIAHYPKDGEDAAHLLRAADTALYAAKAAGKNNFMFFSDEMNKRVQARMRIEAGLRRALEGHEFTLHFQPQVRLTDGSVIGAEALLRWQSAELGSVPPDLFIPIAEETGLIGPIGRWVTDMAVRQAKDWQEAGARDFVMSVNLSTRQLQDPGIVEEVRKALETHCLDATRIDLEITETALLTPTGETQASIAGLHALGVGLSLDDFGIGYSSLSRLKRLPINRLKIDRSFVRDITMDPDDAAIVVAILRMAEALGLDVVAEGVEDRAQADHLLGQGCALAQGYLYGKPMSAEAFAGFIGLAT